MDANPNRINLDRPDSDGINLGDANSDRVNSGRTNCVRLLYHNGENES